MSGWRALMSDVNYGISNVGTVMTSCAGGQAGQIGQYHAKLERVKFGASLDQVCLPCNDLPGPLLVSRKHEYFMFLCQAPSEQFMFHTSSI